MLYQLDYFMPDNKPLSESFLSERELFRRVRDILRKGGTVSLMYKVA